MRAGLLNAVAVMGRTISDAQLGLLAGFQRVTLVMDGEEAGRMASIENGTKLLGQAGRRDVKVVFLPQEAQPDHLPIEDLKRIAGEIS